MKLKLNLNYFVLQQGFKPMTGKISYTSYDTNSEVIADIVNGSVMLENFTITFLLTIFASSL